jgi:hypothetical protein
MFDGKAKAAPVHLPKGDRSEAANPKATSYEQPPRPTAPRLKSSTSLESLDRRCSSNPCTIPVTLRLMRS